jgi:hypothetical protein
MGFGMSMFMLVLLVAAMLFSWAFKSGQCEHVCKSNKHKPEYVLGDGCYCRDGKGLYNPRDSR